MRTDNMMTMLIADDVEVNRASLKEIFKGGFNVLEADDGDVALDILGERRVDIVLLDVFMPRVSGIDVLKVMRSKDAWQKIPVLIKTAVDGDMEEQLLSMGADDFIFSPFDPAVMVNRVKNIMQKYIYEQIILPDTIGRHFKNSVDAIYDIASSFDGDADDAAQTVSAILCEATKLKGMCRDIGESRREDHFNEDNDLNTALVISPDDVYGEYTVTLLDRCGVRAFAVQNSKQALRECTIYYNKGGYGIYIFDSDLDCDSLLSIATGIREMYPDSGARLVGLLDAEGQTDLFEAAGISTIITKPVSTKDFNMLIKSITNLQEEA
jgi:CheY-like chemotaxis protein